MRFWITKNSELPIREQLVRQVLLGILSEDLPPGHKLPSVRAIARRHHIHSNTVSAAYHDLLEQGWLELRRGSGLYVRPMLPSGGKQGELDRLLRRLLQEARSQGYEPDEVLDRLNHLLHPRTYERILIAEPEPAMREILQAELSEQLTIAVEFVDAPDFSDASKLGREFFALRCGYVPCLPHWRDNRCPSQTPSSPSCRGRDPEMGASSIRLLTLSALMAWVPAGVSRNRGLLHRGTKAVLRRPRLCQSR